ncbi:MAG: cytochrome c biogenesis CcdA family protein [Armatimonadota bacterium]
MEQLFTALTHAISGTPLIAVTAAFVWGLLSVVLSPCHLASVPLVVGFISGRQGVTVRRAFWMAMLFALGILLTIAVIGLVTAALGRIWGDIGGFANYLVAGVFLLVGLYLLEVIPLPELASNPLTVKRTDLFAAFLLGLLFGIALGPCSFAFMAPVLGVTFRLAAQSPAVAGMILAAFGIGHCAVIVAAGTSVSLVQRYLNWQESVPIMPIVRKICGVLVILGGLYFIYTAH